LVSIKEGVVKKKLLIITMILILVFSFSACGSKEEANEEVNEETVVEKIEEAIPSEAAGEAEEKKQSSKIVKPGKEYNAGDLSYNIIGLEVKNGVLRINMEIFNNSDEDINFSPMDRLAVFNDNGEECSWNMMIGKLGGLITPNNKIVGETGFDIGSLETDNYMLHIGESFEYKPAIEISSDDIGVAFAEIFEESDIESEYTIGTAVESERFDMLVNGVSIKPSDKEGQEIVLIDLSITNNHSEEQALGFEIAGVYTASGEKLKSAYNDWTFRNYPIDSGETATGIVSYYCEEGKRDFYMVVSPDINDFGRKEIIRFSAL